MCRPEKARCWHNCKGTDTRLGARCLWGPIAVRLYIKERAEGDLRFSQMRIRVFKEEVLPPPPPTLPDRTHETMWA